MPPGPRPGDRVAVRGRDAPFALDADVDADPPAPRDGAPALPLVFDAQRGGGEIEQILAQVDPQRARQVARSAAQISLGDRRRAPPATGSAPPPHQRNAGFRLEGAD